MKGFGELLRNLRRDKSISQRDLAQRVEVDFSYISKLENNRLAPPAADTIVKICEALEVPPDDLLSAAGKVPNDVKDMIGSSASALQFMRRAQEMRLSPHEWDALSKGLKKLRD